MYWTTEMISQLEDAPWPLTLSQLIEYADMRNAGIEVLQNLEEMKAEEGDGGGEEILYHSIEDLVPDMPEDDYYFDDDQEE